MQAPVTSARPQRQSLPAKLGPKTGDLAATSKKEHQKPPESVAGIAVAVADDEAHLDVAANQDALDFELTRELRRLSEELKRVASLDGEGHQEGQAAEME
jgi:hypothetical protein